MGAFLLLNVVQNHLESLKVGVDVGNNCVLHLASSL
jgi:hypothetical protein